MKRFYGSFDELMGIKEKEKKMEEDIFELERKACKEIQMINYIELNRITDGQLFGDNPNFYLKYEIKGCLNKKTYDTVIIKRVDDDYLNIIRFTYKNGDTVIRNYPTIKYNCTTKVANIEETYEDDFYCAIELKSILRNFNLNNKSFKKINIKKK